MSSEWMTVMLDEIARKKEEESAAQIELERRSGVREVQPSSPDLPGGDVPGDARPDESAHG